MEKRGVLAVGLGGVCVRTEKGFLEWTAIQKTEVPLVSFSAPRQNEEKYGGWRAFLFLRRSMLIYTMISKDICIMGRRDVESR